MINEQKELSSFSKKISSPKSRYLVFTSAGDRSNLNYWLEGKQNFDLWITYYGNEKERFKEISDYYLVRKGVSFRTYTTLTETSIIYWQVMKRSS